MSLLQVPLLLLSSVCFQLVMTPPTPPASQAERSKYNGIQSEKQLTGRALGGYAGVFMFMAALHVSNAVQVANILTMAFFPHYSVAFTSWLGTGPRSMFITPEYTLGITLVIAGTIFRLSSFRTLGRFFTFELSMKDEHKLITSGPYAIVRHPGYSAAITVLVGTFLTQFGPGSWWYDGGYRSGVGKVWVTAATYWLLAMAVFFVDRCPKEDKMLRAEFPQEWNEWAQKTPYRLVPYVY